MTRNINLSKIGFDVVTDYESVERLSTGSLVFDWILGGGLPMRRISQLAAWESYGKTTLATYICGHTLKTNRDAVIYYVDTEHTFDRKWAENMGADSRLNLVQPVSGEAALNGIVGLVDKNKATLIVLDTLAALAIEEEIEKPIGEVTMRRSQIFQHFFRQVTSALAKSDATLLVLNQLREKIGSMGDPEVIPGGNAVRFHSSIIMKLDKPSFIIGEGGQLVESPKRPYQRSLKGYVFRPKTVKNKTATPYRQGDVRLMIDPFGIDVASEITQLGKRYGIFVKEDGSEISGACHWFFEEEKVSLSGTGEDAVIENLRSNPELFERCILSIKELMNES